MTITGWAFLSGLTAALVSLLAAVHAIHGRKAARRVGDVFVGLLALLIVAAGVNSYFSYYPTVGSLLGRRATYQATAAQVAQAESLALVSPGRLPAHGMVESVTIPPSVSGFRARRAQVYLPRTWFAAPRPQLPVLMLLHGTPGAPADWTRAGAVDVVAERWAARHGGEAPIIVMPDSNGSFWGDTECVDGRLGKAETYLAVDVPNWVTRQLGASADRSHWAIGGLSSGGTCAIHLALRHPERFSMVLAFGPEAHVSHSGGLTALFGGSQEIAARQADSYAPATLLARYRPTAQQPMRGWFEAGSSDGAIARETVALAGAARRNGIETRVHLIPGGRHTFHVWRTSIRDAYPWIMSGISGSPGSGKVAIVPVGLGG